MANANSVKTPKKYEVWLLPQSGKPDEMQQYIILTDTSPYIVAPVMRGTDDVNKFNIRFKGVCGKLFYVSVNNLKSVPASAFHEKNYSASASYYTVQNTDLHSYIEDAIGALFNITVKSVSYDEAVSRPTKYDPPQEYSQHSVQPIQVTINLNGVSGTVQPEAITSAVTAAVTAADVVTEQPDSTTESVSATETTEDTDVTEPVVESVSDAPDTEAERAPRICKAVEVEQPETEQDQMGEVIIHATKEAHSSVPEFERDACGRLTDFARAKLQTYIINNSDRFGGTMKAREIAEATGVSYITVTNYTNSIQSYLKSMFASKGSSLIPPNLIPKFMQEYSRTTVKKNLLKNWGKYVTGEAKRKKSTNAAVSRYDEVAVLYNLYFHYKRRLEKVSKCKVG